MEGAEVTPAIRCLAPGHAAQLSTCQLWQVRETGRSIGAGGVGCGKSAPLGRVSNGQAAESLAELFDSLAFDEHQDGVIVLFILLHLFVSSVDRRCICLTGNDGGEQLSVAWNIHRIPDEVWFDADYETPLALPLLRGDRLEDSFNRVV
jgi:hypothetical protein